MRIIIIIIAGLLLISCGSKGVLYLPDGEAETKQEAKTQLESTDSDQTASDKKEADNKSSQRTTDAAVFAGLDQ